LREACERQFVQTHAFSTCFGKHGMRSQHRDHDVRVADGIGDMLLPVDAGIQAIFVDPDVVASGCEVRLQAVGHVGAVQSTVTHKHTWSRFVCVRQRCRPSVTADATIPDTRSGIEADLRRLALDARVAELSVVRCRHD